jgi:hypothetical protein
LPGGRSKGVKDLDAKDPKIAGYPARVFPYCIRVDDEGRVAGHGLLSVVLEKFAVDTGSGN